MPQLKWDGPGERERRLQLNCHYCRAQNDAEDHRCGRCGRRLSDEQPSRPAMFPVQQSAAAPAIETLERPAVVPQEPSSRPQLVTGASKRDAAAESAGHEFQPSLFGPVEVPRTMTTRVSRPAPMTPAPSVRRKTARADQQQCLNFDSTSEGSRTLPTSVEARVYCNAEVAPAADRAFAAAVDMLIPAAGMAVLMTSFYFTAGRLVLDQSTLPWYGAAFVLLTLFYRVVCCLGCMDTFGIQCAGLRLLNFDGRRPSRRARFYRLIGGMVSLIALGIGLVWALLEEERLAWHDLMSETFPTRRMY